jgi:hypothetical protein
MVSVEMGLKDRCAFQNVPLLPAPPSKNATDACKSEQRCYPRSFAKIVSTTMTPANPPVTLQKALVNASTPKFSAYNSNPVWHVSHARSKVTTPTTRCLYSQITRKLPFLICRFVAFFLSLVPVSSATSATSSLSFAFGAAGRKTPPASCKMANKNTNKPANVCISFTKCDSFVLLTLRTLNPKPAITHKMAYLKQTRGKKVIEYAPKRLGFLPHVCNFCAVRMFLAYTLTNVLKP